MPAFATSALTDAQLADLTTALADGAAPAL
jgi:hypothetical protein